MPTDHDIEQLMSESKRFPERTNIPVYPGPIAKPLENMGWGYFIECSDDDDVPSN